MLVPGSVGLSKHIPGTPGRKSAARANRPNPPIALCGRLSFKKKRRSRLEHPKRGPTRTPEVHLGDLPSCSQKLVPAVVCRRDESAHLPIVAGRTRRCKH
jgi:hypothetical protein